MEKQRFSLRPLKFSEAGTDILKVKPEPSTSEVIPEAKSKAEGEIT